MTIEQIYADAKIMTENLKNVSLEVEPFIQKQGTFLDLCAGAGAYSIGLSSRLKKSTFICVDIDKDALTAGQKLAEETSVLVQFKEGSANNIPLPDESVDYIISRKSLQYFSPLDVSLKETYRVLKPSGKFFILKHINFPAYPLYHLMKEGNIDFITKKGYYTNLKNWISSKKAVKLLKKTGFKDATIIATDFMLKDISKLNSNFLKNVLKPYAVKPFIIAEK